MPGQYIPTYVLGSGKFEPKLIRMGPFLFPPGQDVTFDLSQGQFQGSAIPSVYAVEISGLNSVQQLTLSFPISGQRIFWAPGAPAHTGSYILPVLCPNPIQFGGRVDGGVGVFPPTSVTLINRFMRQV